MSDHRTITPPKRATERVRTWVLVVALGAVGACSLAPDPAPPPQVDRVPEAFVGAEVAGPADGLRWWTSFADPTLNALVDTVLAANLDIVGAYARVREAQALARVSRAALFPAVDATGSASDQRSPANSGFGQQFAQLLGGAAGDSTGDPGGSGGGDDEDAALRRFETTTYSLSVGLSYEVDFWGRAGNDAQAAAREFLATEADMELVRLGVLAETVTAYFQIVDLRERIGLTTATIDVLQEREALSRDRYDRGLVGSFELYQVRADLRNAESTLPELTTQLADARARLSLLAGRYSTEFTEALDGPMEPVTVLDPVPVGLPADLLGQRPDVRAAQERYEAARLRVGARKAELLPRLTLSSSVGLQSAEANGLFDLDQWFSNLAAGLTAPLFQGGRLRANLTAAEARYAQQAAALGSTVLSAVGEVETSLVRYREARVRLQALEAQLEEARSSVGLQANRYRSGVSGYPDYLDALRSELGVQSFLSLARRQVALALLGVHRALGGGWIEEQR